MSVELSLVDFTATGVLGSAWTATGGTFIHDGQRARTAAAGVYSRAVLVAVPPFSASNPIRGRYEVDVLLPPAFPASGVVRGGVVFAGGYGHLVWHRSSGGSSTLFDFFARHGTTGVETSYYSLTVALSAATTVRIRADVSYHAGALVVDAWYSTTAGASWSYLFLSTPSTASWNTATGQVLATITDSARTGGIVATAPVDMFLDNYRVTDLGNLAAALPVAPAPTLTTFPTLTPYTMSAEDDGTVQTLSVQPSYAMQVADVWEITEHPYEGGYVGTLARQTVRRRQWRFHWDAMNSSEFTAFGALRTAVAGRRSAFTWTDATTNEVIRIKFAEDPSGSLVSPGVYQADALVTEILADA